MSAKPPTQPTPPQADPEAWQRFERAVDAALHTAPKHREAKVKLESSPPKSPKTPK